MLGSYVRVLVHAGAPRTLSSSRIPRSSLAIAGGLTYPVADIGGGWVIHG
jgi:hypothetical protein